MIFQKASKVVHTALFSHVFCTVTRSRGASNNRNVYYKFHCTPNRAVLFLSLQHKAKPRYLSAKHRVLVKFIKNMKVYTVLLKFLNVNS